MGSAEAVKFIIQHVVVYAQIAVRLILAGDLSAQFAVLLVSCDSTSVRTLQLLLELRNLTGKTIVSSAQIRVIGHKGVELVAKGLFLHT